MMSRQRRSPLLTTAEAAVWLRIKPHTLENMRYQGTGPKFRKHGGRVFYLANSTPVSWEEFGNVAARLMGRELRTFAIPEKAAYVLGLCAEWWASLSGKPGILSRDKVREACCPGWVCDPARARHELGFCAVTSLEEGLRRTLHWYKEAGWLQF